MTYKHRIAGGIVQHTLSAKAQMHVVQPGSIRKIEMIQNQCVLFVHRVSIFVSRRV